MPRYIITELCDEIIEKELGFYDTTELKEMLSHFPTADVQEVRHGKYNSKGHCSFCNTLIPTDDRKDYISRDEVRYCYFCGAKMDLEQNNC